MKMERPTISSLEQAAVPAKVSHQRMNIDGSDREAFFVKLPPGHTYPKLHERRHPPSRENPMETPAAGFVTEFPPFMEELEAKQLPYNDEREFRFGLVHDETDPAMWHLDMKTELPAALIEVLKAALAHEASINPRMNEGTWEVAVRYGDLAELGQGAFDPHFDFGHELSMYVISSSPTTHEYVGKLTPEMRTKDDHNDVTAAPGATWWKRERVAAEVAWSSLKPWTLYRATDVWLHSAPSGALDGPGSDGGKRFFMRAAFSRR